MRQKTLITIRRIQIGEADLFKQLRLTSLQDAPYAFSSTYDSALQRSAEAKGLAVAFLHKAATDPNLVPGEMFYVVTTASQAKQLPSLFIQRLMSATFHTILPEWQGYLLNAGFKHQLITRLPMAGNGDFTHALRVERSPQGWQDVISHGLRTGKITF